jgi:class 3 adenylate cyclase
MRASDYPWGQTQEDAESIVASLGEVYGTDAFSALANPDADAALVRWQNKACRLSCSRRAYVAYMRDVIRMDVRDVLPSVQVPTLVMHRQHAPYITVEQGRDLAERIPGSRFVVVPGSDNNLYTKPNSQILDHIEGFLTGAGPSSHIDRTLAAVLFTDIVGSTERAAAVGDRRWRNLLESHDAVTRTIVEEHGGRLVKSTGDGALCTFDGPGRAIRCAAALRDALQPLGIDIRAGLHAGEIERHGDDIGGIGVHLAARVVEQAGRGEVLVSAAVPLLVAGSGIEFEDRAEHDLKGIPGPIRLFAVAD